MITRLDDTHELIASDGEENLAGDYAVLRTQIGATAGPRVWVDGLGWTLAGWCYTAGDPAYVCAVYRFEVEP